MAGSVLAFSVAENIPRGSGGQGQAGPTCCVCSCAGWLSGGCFRVTLVHRIGRERKRRTDGWNSCRKRAYGSSPSGKAQISE
jgi:hypothetical protein